MLADDPCHQGAQDPSLVYLCLSCFSMLNQSHKGSVLLGQLGLLAPDIELSGVSFSFVQTTT